MMIWTSEMFRIGAITVLFCAQLAVAAQVDKTRNPRESGNHVVEAVVDLIHSRCIFPNDRLFLRRLAYAESTDGEDSNTYGNNFYGGIWRVQEDMFDETKTPAAAVNLSATIEAIDTNFSIKWASVSWQDLEKPLFSGLAAVLYLHLQNKTIPGNLTEQAYFWKATYNPLGNTQTFIDKVSSLNEVSCESKPVDIVFVVDESGSIGSANFVVMKHFLVKIVDQITIGPNAFNVGLVKFQSSATVQFYLNSYQNKTSIKNAILNMSYRSGGTSISAGIEKARTQVFPGARDEATKVILLLTDGVSNIIYTQQAADIARNESIVIFALGIGNINKLELNAAGNDPDCRHVFIINGFNEIDSILYEIKKGACTVAKPIEVPNTGESSVEGTLTGSEAVEDIVEITQANNNVTSIVTEVTCGNVTLYASADTMRPNEAFYTVMAFAEDGYPALISIENDGRKVFLSYTAFKSKVCASGSFDITISAGPVKAAEVVCIKNNKTRECTILDFMESKYKDLICPEKDLWTDVSNPCTSITPETFYPHPSDPLKFIHCKDGLMYVTQCPPGTTYSSQNSRCLHPFTTTTEAPNPCANAAATGNFYYPYPTDPHKFIQCDAFGNSYIITCSAGLVWNNAIKACDHPTT